LQRERDRQGLIVQIVRNTPSGRGLPRLQHADSAFAGRWLRLSSPFDVCEQFAIRNHGLIGQLADGIVGIKRAAT
jgi:hypothetical protein